MILSGAIYLMDQQGMYNYGTLKEGSYFGDLNLLLGKINSFSYFYDPFTDKPLQLLRVKKQDFLKIINEHPFEKELFTERAKKRDEMF